MNLRPVICAAVGAFLLVACSAASDRPEAKNGAITPPTLASWAENACRSPSENQLDMVSARPLDLCYQPEVILTDHGLRSGLQGFRETADRHFRKFEDEIDDWLQQSNQLPDELLFPVKCRLDLDYGAEIYAATDMVIDCLRDQSCRSENAKNFEPDNIVPLRQGSEAECKSRDPSARQMNLAKNIKAGLKWRRDIAKEAIDERLKSGPDAYLVESAIADVLNYHYSTSVLNGLIGWRARERDESLLTLDSLKRSLGLLLQEGLSDDEKCGFAVNVIVAVQGNPQLFESINYQANRVIRAIESRYCGEEW